jgi:hypothetical protein
MRDAAVDHHSADSFRWRYCGGLMRRRARCAGDTTLRKPLLVFESVVSTSFIGTNREAGLVEIASVVAR